MSATPQRQLASVGQTAPQRTAAASAPAVVSHLHCSSIEQLEAVFRGAGQQLELLQLDPGLFEAQVWRLQLPPLKLKRVRLNRAIHTQGMKLPGHLTVSLSLQAPLVAQPVRSHGRELPDTCLFGMDNKLEVHVHTPARSDLGFVMVAPEELRRWAARLGVELPEDGCIASNWLQLDAQRYEGLRRYLVELFSLIEQRPEQLERPELARLVLEDLIPLLLEALVHGAGLQRRLLRAPARLELVQIAQQWMAEHPFEPITLDALCREIHVGRRSLIQGFRDHLGLGPMAYLKLQRLHGVRRLLVEAQPGQTRITEVAATWGFLNPGHFARDYRRLFGERPSETLAAGRR